MSAISVVIYFYISFRESHCLFEVSHIVIWHLFRLNFIQFRAKEQMLCCQWHFSRGLKSITPRFFIKFPPAALVSIGKFPFFFKCHREIINEAMRAEGRINNSRPIRECVLVREKLIEFIRTAAESSHGIASGCGSVFSG